MKIDDRVRVIADKAPSCRTGTIVEVYPDDQGYLVHHDEPAFSEGLFAGKQRFSWTAGEVVPLGSGPVLYLSNWSSHATVGHHGPGRKLTIMARPRRWERGEGVVLLLTPDGDDLARVKADPAWLPTYRKRYEGELVMLGLGEMLTPGHLVASLEHGEAPVSAGDTLCCSCSRDTAAQGWCHRVWAATALQKAGWQVVLDGEVLNAR